MLRIIITGGIGSGKSTASDHFASLGVPVIDADVIAREITRPGQPALDEIRSHFGERVFTDNQLNRSALKTHIFSDPEARKKLESILHPEIRSEIKARIQSLDCPYAIIVIPLLTETAQKDLADRVLVIDCPADTQKQRVSRRDNLSDTEIKNIMASQASREQRLAYADDIVENTGNMDDFTVKLDMLHQQYTQLASQSGDRR